MGGDKGLFGLGKVTSVKKDTVITKATQKELLMTEKNVYSRAYHHVKTRTGCAILARRHGNAAVEEWLNSL